jgi:predicted RNA-binding Zn ribbon-like protein
MPLQPTTLEAPRDHHHHGLSLEDASDFMNTLALKSGSLVDQFTTFDDAASWLTERGISHEGLSAAALRAPGVSDDEALARVRSVREAMREVSHAVAEDRPPTEAALAEVNRALRARERIELVRAPDGVSVGHSHVGDPLDDALARLAEPLVEEIQAGRADRVRICANATCAWVFFDESRAGHRRWCDMASCGNRAKAARHRARAKVVAPASADASPPTS